MRLPLGRSAGRVLLAAALWAAAPAGARAAQDGQVLVLADFNDAQRNAARRNEVGGAYQAWMLNPECHCVQTLIADDALGAAGGQALQLEFEVACPPYFNGWFMFLTPEVQGSMDLTPYDRLGLFVRGNSGFALEVKDRTSKDDGTPAGVAQYVVTRMAERWQRVEVPFTQFVPKGRGTIDWSGIRQVVVVFSDLRSNAAGRVALDHLYVSRGPAGGGTGR